VAVKLDLRFSQNIETLNDLVTIHLQVGFYLLHSLEEQFLFSFSHMLICKNAKTLSLTWKSKKRVEFQNLNFFVYHPMCVCVCFFFSFWGGRGAKCSSVWVIDGPLKYICYWPIIYNLRWVFTVRYTHGATKKWKRYTTLFIFYTISCKIPTLQYILSYA
jgi:hypothetical protein